MHEKAYFLHKKHHQGSANILASQTAMFDLFDMVLEFGAGIPLLGFLKKLLGLDYRVHFLTHILKIIMGFWPTLGTHMRLHVQMFPEYLDVALFGFLFKST